MYHLITEKSPKLIRGRPHGWRSGILYLAPCNLSGRNVCPRSSRGCKASCLYTAGRGAFERTQAARMRKTKQYHAHPAAFMHLLAADIHALCALCDMDGDIHRPCVRLNGTSDIDWAAAGIFKQFPAVQFYDYTKVESRMDAWLAGNRPANYHLTWSRSERRDRYALTVLERGGIVSVVFGGDIPATWRGYPTVNGDQHDLTFLYPAGHVVALSAKGRAKQDSTGFVIRQ